MKDKQCFNYIRSMVSRMLCCVTFCLLFSCSPQRSTGFLQLQGIFEQANEAHRDGKSAEAMNGFKQCVNLCSKAQYEQDDSVKLLLPKAMGQLLNEFQAQSNPEGCVAYFDSLRQEVDAQPTEYNKVLCQYFKRDVYVLLAYALSRTDAEQQGVQLMDQALAMPLSYPTPERKFRDYAYATGVYFCLPSCQKQVMEYGRKALDEVKKCQNKSGAQWLVTALGAMYHRQGKIDKAIKMYQEGYDLAVMSNDTLGMANAQKVMADYLLQWKLDSISNGYATEAVNLLKHVTNANPMVATGIYVTKARVLKIMHKKGEALECLKLARKQCVGLPYNSGASDVDLLKGSLLVTKAHPCYPADYNLGLSLLKSAANSGTYQIKARAFFELAKANIEHGKLSEGEAALDSMWTLLHSQPSSLVIDGAYDYAMDYYLKQGNQAKAALYSNALKQVKSEAEQAASIKNVMDAVNHMEKEKDENAKLAQKEAARHRVMDVVLWAGMVVFIIVVVVLFAYKRRQYIRKHALAREKLSQMAEKLRQTVNQKDKALESLAAVKAENVQQIQSTDKLLDVLKNQGLDKFLEAFGKAYPYFLETLNRDVPNLTDKDRVYCCLMGLGVDNVGTTEVLKVERSTVTMAKYRLRKKLAMPGTAEMEQYLKNLLVDNKPG